jgi:hypothetical protein
MSDDELARFAAKWQAGEDLGYLWDRLGTKATPRQRRLFSLACFCSRQKRLGRQLRQVIDIVERYVDGAASPDELAAAARIVARYRFRRGNTGDLVLAASPEDALAASWSGSLGRADPWEEEDLPVVRQRLIVLHEIVGNPFRDRPLAGSLLAWNDGTIPKLAQAIYQERAFDRMPILGDALEEAGCGDADLLAHCRGPWEHVRGCWLVDDLITP